MIDKPGKEDYHVCSSYKTVSIKTILGKHFGKVTSRRLMACLEEINFDVNQYAYMQGRIAAQLLLYITQTAKSAIANNLVAGSVFYDFTDALGSVNRDKLLLKLNSDFNINGQLFLHLASFFDNRMAQIKVNDVTGDWKPSNVGTSAGTIFGPMLFTSYFHDAPDTVKPKFADDTSSVAVGLNVKDVEYKLQISTNEMEA